MKIPVIKTMYAAIVLCGIAYAFVVLRGENGISALLAKREQVHQLEQNNLKLAREIEQEKDRIQRLQDNPAEQEHEIRQRLKLAKPGEKIYILDDKQAVK